LEESHGELTMKEVYVKGYRVINIQGTLNNLCPNMEYTLSYRKYNSLIPYTKNKNLEKSGIKLVALESTTEDENEDDDD